MARRKKNLRKIPEETLEKLDTIQDQNIIVACTKQITFIDIANGLYAHLGISADGDQIITPDDFVPLPTMGRYCKYNLYGREIVRRDLEKVPKITSIEVPNFGDWSKGSHTIDLRRDVYPRDFIPPQDVCIQIEILEENPTPNRYIVVKFAVSSILNKNDEDFLVNLLFNLNILQENIGQGDVFASTTPISQYLGALTVNWEILPIGTADDVIIRNLMGGRVNQTFHGKIMERLQVLRQLNPRAIIQGSNGFTRYFGAQFTDNLVAFENIEYGNAIYIMFEEWETLSQVSRTELLKNNRNRFERVIHRPGWQLNLTRIIQEHR